MARLQGARKGSTPAQADDLAEAVLAIRREKLPRPFRAVYDSLLIEILLEAKKRTALKARLYQVPAPERGPEVVRTIETLEAIDFFLIIAQHDIAKICAAWLSILKTELPFESKKEYMSVITGQATTRPMREAWRDTLKTALRDRKAKSEADEIGAELKYIEDELKKNP